jgi:hypothetical protein
VSSIRPRSREPQDDEDGDDDEDDNSEVDKSLRALRKLGVQGLNFGQQNTDEVTDRGRGHQNMSAEVETVHDDYPYKLSDTPAVGGQKTKHKFEQKIDSIQQNEKCGRQEATTRARIRHPTLYSSYQGYAAMQSTKDQATRGFDRGVGKRGPNSYEDLVATEIRKGCSHELAQQRVAQAHGFRAFDQQMFKGESAVAKFESKVNALIDQGLSGEEACRLVRKTEPNLFKAMQIV